MLILLFAFGAEVEVWTNSALVADTFNWLHSTAIASNAIMNILSRRFLQFQERMRGRMNIFLFTGRTKIKIRTNCALVTVTRNRQHPTTITFDIRMRWNTLFLRTRNFLFLRSTFATLLAVLFFTTAEVEGKSLTPKDSFEMFF
jgi:hypothetical protein